jgi:predicted nucleic acid-binding Zn ribbon protein
MTRAIDADRPALSGEQQLVERRKRLRQRNWALLAALIGFVVLVYVITIVKLKGA